MASPTPAHSATTARVDLRYGELYRSWLPMIIVHLPAPEDDPWPALDPMLQHLRDVGWIHPGPILRGAHSPTATYAIVDGALQDGPVSVSGGGLMLYQGTLRRSPSWISAARSAGIVAVLVTTLSNDEAPGARDGEVLAARGLLFHRSQRVPDPIEASPQVEDATPPL